MLSDHDFRQQFELLSLPPEQFDHAGHMRIALLYLNQFGLELAEQKLCQGIAKYAASLGATGKFNHTITVVLARLIWYRIQQRPQAGWQEFLQDNPAMLDNAKPLLLTYYSEGVIFGEAAKQGFIAPDKQALPT